MFDPLTALAVTITLIISEGLFVAFAQAVIDKKKVLAGSYSAAYNVIIAFAVINYTQNSIYVIFAALGAFLGTVLTMFVSKRD